MTVSYTHLDVYKRQAETHEYDVVVVGAGESGLSAVHTALEAGARVACVQNINAAQTTGNMAASIDLTQTDEAAVQACVSFINWKDVYKRQSHRIQCPRGLRSRACRKDVS